MGRISTLLGVLVVHTRVATVVIVLVVVVVLSVVVVSRVTICVRGLLALYLLAFELDVLQYDQLVHRIMIFKSNKPKPSTPACCLIPLELALGHRTVCLKEPLDLSLVSFWQTSNKYLGTFVLGLVLWYCPLHIHIFSVDVVRFLCNCFIDSCRILESYKCESFADLGFPIPDMYQLLDLSEL